MTSLAPNADLVVRHAVDAYIDGRLLPAFEGEAFFETRNSRYRLLDGVLFAAPNSALVGAELVGWLVDYVSRSEVVPAWRSGARAVLVDTRNDGVHGPQIVVTSATRAFQSERDVRQSSPRDVRQSSPRDVRQSSPRDVRQSSPRDVRQSSPRDSFQSAPRVAAPPPAVPPARAGSRMPQSGSTLPPPAAPMPRTLPPPPPLPTYRPASVPPPAMVVAPPTMLPHTLPPPPPAPRPLPRARRPAIAPALPPPAFADEVAARKIAAIEASIEAAWIPNEDTEDASPTLRNEKWHDVRQSLPHTSSRLSHGRGLSQRLPAPPASVPFLLSRTASRSHQRGMPLR